MSKVTSDLYRLPGILGELGKNVADAQKELNADYVENLKIVLETIKNTVQGLGDDQAATRDLMKSLIESLAPSRYQFTETTLDFSADLSERLDVGAEIGAGAGFGAIMVTAALSVGYGYDYRAAARVTSRLHAIASSQALTKTMLDRVDKIDANKLQLPAKRDPVDKELWDRVTHVFDAVKPGSTGGGN